MKLSVTGADASGVAKMCVSNTATTPDACSSYAAYSTAPFDHTLSGDAAAGGTRTVALFLEDAAGNRNAAPITATILYNAPDTTPPTGTLAINGGATSTSSLAVKLSVTGADASGVAKMCVSNTATTADACPSYIAYSTAPFDHTLSGDAAAGGSRVVALFLEDAAGNRNAAAITATILYTVPNTTPPRTAI